MTTAPWLLSKPARSAADLPKLRRSRTSLVCSCSRARRSSTSVVPSVDPSSTHTTSQTRPVPAQACSISSSSGTIASRSLNTGMTTERSVGAPRERPASVDASVARSFADGMSSIIFAGPHIRAGAGRKRTSNWVLCRRCPAHEDPAVREASGPRSELGGAPPESRDFGQETDNAAKYEQAGGVESRLLARFRERLLDEVVAPGARAACSTPVAGRGTSPRGSRRRSRPARSRGSRDARGRWSTSGSAIPACARWRAISARCRSRTTPSSSWSAPRCSSTSPSPRKALRELTRVCAGHLFLTVPHEPFFRAGNLARGRYLSRLGSTPGHLSTWGRRGFTARGGRRGRADSLGVPVPVAGRARPPAARPSGHRAGSPGMTSSLRHRGEPGARIAGWGPRAAGRRCRSHGARVRAAGPGSGPDPLRGRGLHLLHRHARTGCAASGSGLPHVDHSAAALRAGLVLDAVRRRQHRPDPAAFADVRHRAGAAGVRPRAARWAARGSACWPRC